YSSSSCCPYGACLKRFRKSWMSLYVTSARLYSLKMTSSSTAVLVVLPSASLLLSCKFLKIWLTSQLRPASVTLCDDLPNTVKTWSLTTSRISCSVLLSAVALTNFLLIWLVMWSSRSSANLMWPSMWSPGSQYTPGRTPATFEASPRLSWAPLGLELARSPATDPSFHRHGHHQRTQRIHHRHDGPRWANHMTTPRGCDSGPDQTG